MPAARVTQAEVARAIRGAVQAGFEIGAVEVRPDGAIRILPKPDEPAQPAERKPEQWE